ncbi:eukaryotic translation initiation factor 4B3-like [Primulina huaijiensis]
MDDGEKGSGIKIDAKPKGNNPFGEARPREEVLKELGQDVNEIEEKLESTKIKGVAADDDKEKGFWSGKGRETAWRKPESVDSRPERDEKSANGATEKSENEHAEGEDARMF